MKKIMIGESENFMEGKGKTIFVSGKEFAIFRYQGELGCINNRCIHEGGALGAGQLKDGKVECPKHNWLWDFQTGIGQYGDTVEGYKIWEKDGKVYIDLDELLGV